MVAKRSLENDLAQAAAVYRAILAQYPENAEVLNLLGMTEAQINPLAAIEMIDRAIKIEPRNAGFFSNRGIVLQQMESFEEALASYNQALALKADYVSVLNNRGLVLRELKRFDEALESFDKALAMRPNYAEALNNRGLVLRDLKRFDEALDSIDRALAIKPDLPSAAINRELALFGLRKLARYPPLAARALFDEFSLHYDKTMLDVLCYRSHIHVRSLADRLVPRLTPPLRILDLGTGTGLVGDVFKDLAIGGRLDGIDLAPRMIEAARVRGIYDDLILGDIETVLAEPGRMYNLVVSADTMVYLGDLAPTFSGVAKRLTPGGFYVFACESKPDDGWEQTPANRFRHSQAYLQAEAARAGLEFVDIMECSLRKHAEESVPGFTVALRKPVIQTPQAKEQPSRDGGTQHMLPKVVLATCGEVDYLLFSTEDLITSSLLKTGSWEKHLTLITKVFIAGTDMPLVLDIGANLGSYAIPIGKELEKAGGTLYAFEAQRIVYYQLCANILLNRLQNVFAFHQAVGERDGNILIPVPDYANFSNVGAFSIEKKYRDLNGTEAAMRNVIEAVPMIRLDSLSLPNAPTLIKLDVEGYELNVLQGAANFLKNSSYPPILFEAWDTVWFEKEKMALLEFMRQLGYDVTSLGGYDHIAQHQANPIHVEFAVQNDGQVSMRKRIA